MKLSHALIGFMILLLLNTHNLYAQRYKNAISVSERYYDDGNYKKAYDLCLRTTNRLKRQKDNHRIVVLMQMYQAKYAEAIGNYPHFESLLNQSLQQKKILYPRKKIPLGKAYAEIAQLYLNYSHINKAEQYLDSALKVFNTSINEKGKFTAKFTDITIPTKLLFIKAQIAYERGQAQKLHQLIPALLGLESQILEKKDDLKYFDEIENKYVIKKIDAIQLKRYKNQYAQIMTLRADAWRKQGNYKKARYYLNRANGWITDHLNTREIAFIRSQHVENLMDLDSAKNIREVRRMMEKNLYRAERVLTTVHKDYIRIHRDLIDFYMNFMFRQKRNNELWEYSENAEKYYGYNNIQNRDAQRINNEKKFMDYALGGITFNNTLNNLFFKLSRVGQKLLFWKKKQENTSESTNLSDDIYNDLMKLSNNTKDIPLNHIERIRVLKWAYKLGVVLGGREKSVHESLTKLLHGVELIYGKNAIAYQEVKMLEAEYYQNYTNRFDKVQNIYNTTFYRDLPEFLTKNNARYLAYLDQLSNFHEMTEQYDSMKIQINAALQLSQELYGVNHPKYAHYLERKARFDMLKGNYNGADSLLKKALKIFETQRNPDAYALEYAQALQTSANYHIAMGVYDEANKSFTKIQRKYDKIITGSSGQDELAYLYIKMDELDVAERILKRSLRIKKERYGEDSRFLVSTYNQYSQLMRIRGKYGKSESYINQALDIAYKKFGKKSIKTVPSIIAVSELYEAKGDYEKAENELNRAINILQENYGRDHVQVAIAFQQLALLKFYKGDKKEFVERLLSDSEKIIAANLGKKTPIYAESLIALARFYITQNKLSKASSNLTQAAHIWNNTLGTEYNRNTANINILLGDIKLNEGRYRSAQNHYEKAQKIYKKVLGKNHSEYAMALSKSAKLYYVSKNYKASKSYIDKSLTLYKNDIAQKFPIYTDDEKYQYWTKIKGDFEFYIVLMVKMSRKNPELLGEVYNNHLMTKTLLLNASLGRIREQIASDSVLRRDYNKWQTDKREYVKVLGLSANEQKELNIDLKEMQKNIERLEKELYTRLDINDHKNNTKWQSIRDQLSEDEVAIEIIRYRNFEKTFSDSVIYAALMITPDKKLKAPRFIPFKNGNQMESKYLRYYRNNIRFGVNDWKSYQRYWQPVDALLPNRPDLKVYLSTEGVYNQINLEPMLKDRKTYVIDKINIIQLGSTKSLVKAKKKQQSGQYVRSNVQRSHEFVIIGNPVFYQDLTNKPETWSQISNRQIPQLPGAQAEAEAISRLFSKHDNLPQTLLNLNANEDSLQEIKSPKILHIATHGFFADDEQENNNILLKEKTKNNPLLRSGLLMKYAGDLMSSGNVYSYNKYPGVLTAFEVKSLQLEGTDLAVLSACETGRGDVKKGNGVAGLQRAFLAAGVQNLVMSLFKVDDNATRKLMELFYTKWLQTNDLRGSFLYAKRTLRTIKQFRKPKYWSSFIMISTQKP